MKTKKFKMAVHQAEEGGFWASFPELPGCFTQGDSLEEIREKAKEAVTLFFSGDGEKTAALDEVVSVEDVEISIDAA